MTAPRHQPHFMLSLGKSLAQITAEFSPIPGYGLLASALCSILEVCDNVSQNRFAARQLAERAHYFLLALRDSEEKGAIANPRIAKAAAQNELMKIANNMERWAKMGKVKSFINQDEVSKEIAECHASLSDCITKLQLSSQFEILDWQKDFEKRSQQDHKEMVVHLAEIEAKQDLANDVLRENNDMLKTLMTMMQTAMGENKLAAERIQHGLSLNLYQLQKQSGQLLPNFNLSSGEVRRTSQFPVRGNATMDIYEGVYLGTERVSMKAIRAMKTDDRTVHRFKREGEIWAKVWERDRGRYIVPFYGFCQIDTPFPYMISPWQKNGDAISYVRNNDHSIDYLAFIKQIAEGVELLHTFNPPILHGDVKPTNILITDDGRPRLTDFGLSQVINDVSSTPFTQSSIVADSFRYFAPEVCTGSGSMSTMADIYALGMTVLEILTHQQPYAKVRLHTEAVVRAATGRKPERPTEDRVIARGLNDELWNSAERIPSLFVYHCAMSSSDVQESEPRSGAEQSFDSIGSFFSDILKPGSSLQPKFLALLDGAFASLFVILVLLAFLTSGNPHFFALIIIEIALWASVKWFVNELKNLPVESGNASEDRNTRAQGEKKDQ